MANAPTIHDVLVLGGGQAGLATGYFLRRHKLDYHILDGEAAPGGAWRHGWESLHLFSPEKWSSLPGWPMPRSGNEWPPRDHVIDYLTAYERRYRLPVERPVEVQSVTAEDKWLQVHTDHGNYLARAVVSATGTWRHPFIPDYPGRKTFQGQQIHSADYRRPEDFRDQRVLIVGGGNSGAQILAEISRQADVTWVTSEPPHFLPDNVDGRVLFERATEKWKAQKEGREYHAEGNLADIVMVPPVKEAHARGVLESRRPFERFTEQGVIWPDGTQEAIDAVIWCTGFRPALDHLRGLNVIEADGRIDVEGAHSRKQPRLWLVGYGDWTGFASATLIGVMRSARDTAKQIAAALEQETTP